MSLVLQMLQDFSPSLCSIAIDQNKMDLTGLQREDYSHIMVFLPALHSRSGKVYLISSGTLRQTKEIPCTGNMWSVLSVNSGIKLEVTCCWWKAAEILLFFPDDTEGRRDDTILSQSESMQLEIFTFPA